MRIIEEKFEAKEKALTDYRLKSIEELKAQHTKQLVSLKFDHIKTLKRVKGENEQSINAARTDFGKTMDQEKAHHIGEMEQINADNAQVIEQLRDEVQQLQSKGGSFLLHHTEAVKQLKADNAEAMKALKSKHAKAFDLREREHKAEFEAQEKRYDELQSRLNAATDATKKESQKLERALAEDRGPAIPMRHAQDLLQSTRME